MVNIWKKMWVSFLHYNIWINCWFWLPKKGTTEILTDFFLLLPREEFRLWQYSMFRGKNFGQRHMRMLWDWWMLGTKSDRRRNCLFVCWLLFMFKYKYKCSTHNAEINKYWERFSQVCFFFSNLFFSHLSQRTFAGADPGFPQQGAPTLWGRQHMILPNFPKNCMKVRKFLAGGRGGPPR